LGTVALAAPPVDLPYPLRVSGTYDVLLGCACVLSATGCVIVATVMMRSLPLIVALCAASACG
jgi:hypothetical protein